MPPRLVTPEARPSQMAFSHVCVSDCSRALGGAPPPYRAQLLTRNSATHKSVGGRLLPDATAAYNCTFIKVHRD